MYFWDRLPLAIIFGALYTGQNVSIKQQKIDFIEIGSHFKEFHFYIADLMSELFLNTLSIKVGIIQQKLIIMKELKNVRPLLFGLMTIFFLSSFTSSEPKNENPVMKTLGWFWGDKCSTIDNDGEYRTVKCCKRRFGISFGCKEQRLPEYQD